MRLLNVRTEQVEEFTGDDRPQYAILSHRWGADEVSFQDMATMTKAQLAEKEGYQKIMFCCQQAQRDGLKYCWVDTCSIDKSSSAELSEAINSMFRYYEQAKICYAYLSDIPGKGFTQSEWFTRGWTLQELIAPCHVVFYDKDWKEITTKGESIDMLAKSTGIDSATLRNSRSLSSVNVGRRMSWAAHRKTTRVEDTAYCLMGLFDVNMPLLYGEGEKAFIRLQEEIIKESDDQSIFAWEAEDHPNVPTLGILAAHPSAFKDTGDINAYPGYGQPYMMTNRGVQIQIPLLRPRGVNKLHGILNCTRQSGSFLSQLAIPLRLTANGDSSLGRIPGWPLREISELEAQHSTVYTAYLAKLSVPAPFTAAGQIGVELYGQRSGYRLKSSIFAAKPLTSLTEYTRDGVQALPYNWLRDAYKKDRYAIPLPNDRYDYAAALRFGLIADPSSDFLVLLESEKIRQSWNMELPKISSDDLEIILERRVGRFRTAAMPTGVDSQLYQVRAEQSIRIQPGIAITAYIAAESGTSKQNFRLVVEVKVSPGFKARTERAQSEIFELPG
jgi:hypothetical protein